MFECEKIIRMLSVLKMNLPSDQQLNMFSIFYTEPNKTEETEEQNFGVYIFNEC